MRGLLTHAVELVPELPNDFALVPGEAGIGLAHHQDLLLEPAFLLDLFGIPTVSAKPSRRPPHRMPPLVSMAHRSRAMASARSEERRVGKECVSTCRYRWSTHHSKKTKIIHN